MGVDFRSRHLLSVGSLGDLCSLAPSSTINFVMKSDRYDTKGVEGIATLGLLVS